MLDQATAGNRSNSPFGDIIPLLQTVMGGGDGGSGTTFRDLLSEEERKEDQSLLMKLVLDMTIQDVLSIMSENFGALTGLQPKMKECLLREGMNNEDTPQRREAVSEEIANTINS